MDVIVSGFSLRLPESDSPAEFWRNLVAHRDMVSSENRNWNPDDFGVPARYAKLRTYDKFDSQFFGIHPRQAEKLDPQIRLLLEVSHEAVLDAGLCPRDLAGTNTGVFVGACGSDVMSNNVNALDKLTGYEATGCAMSMFANRLSYYLDLRGPSLVVDTACSSSLTAFDMAYSAITSGRCDKALVGGANFIFHPLWTVGFNKLNMLSPDGRCMSFNDDGRGFVRAEGIVVLLLTREDLARKKYARVLASRCNNDGFTEQGITFPGVESQKNLVRELYKESGLHPDAVDYAETHGTGTVAGDPVELNAIDEVLFGELKRTRPMLVGSVKSNMGHSEGASGLAGVAKVLLAMLHESIPANLNADKPRREISGLSNGHFEIVKTNRAFTKGVASVSSFGFGGSNAHIVLESIPPSPVPEAEFLPMPFYAHTSAGRDELLQELMNRSDTTELSAFLTSIDLRTLTNNPHRGFVLKQKHSGEVTHVVGEHHGPRRPVWLILNGVGSQWNGMGRGLLQLPVARQYLERCHTAIARHGIDLIEVLSTDAPDTWTNPIHIFAGVAAVQIALYECIRALKIEVDGFFGHSVGELACAYIDGAISLEQCMDIAYYRGTVLVENQCEPGAMAAVQIDLASLQERLPPGVEIACHNSRDSFTISGLHDAVVTLAASLDAEGFLCKVLHTGRIPFHSSYIQGAREKYFSYLHTILPEPRERSARWLSSSRDSSAVGGPDLADVRYFIDNLLEPVHFARCLRALPPNAVLIEIGPQGLLKSQCVAELPEASYASLSKRHTPTPLPVWQGFGELFCLGVPMRWGDLCTEVHMENPLVQIEHLVSWDHRDTWALPEIKFGAGTGTDYIEEWLIDIDEPENAFVRDHIVNGNPIFPGVGYLNLVWLTLAKWKRQDPETLAIELQNIRFVRASIFRNTSRITLTIKIDILKSTFAVLEGNQLVADGAIASTGTVAMSHDDFATDWRQNPQSLERADVYKLFVKTGIEYGSLFRGISLVAAARDRALVDWTLNWPTYFDAVLQLLFINSATETIGVPRSIDSFRFDPTRLPGTRTDIPATIVGSDASVRTPCVEIEGVSIHSNYVPEREPCELHVVEFKPYFAQSTFEPDVREYLDVCRDLLLDNLHRVLTQEDLAAFSNIDHLSKIASNLGSMVRAGPPSPALIERYRHEPRAHILRLIQFMFANWQELVVNAMPLMLSYPEYKNVYRNDLFTGPREQILQNMLELVIQNSDTAVLRAIEIGAGTGALTSIALPYLARYAVSYEVSDISAGYFQDLASEFGRFDAKTKYVVWDANGPSPSIGQYDLIMGSNSVHTVSNIGATLAHVAAGLREGGFFLIEEMTGDFWFSLGLWGFIRDFWSFDDVRTCGMYLDRDGWVNAAAQVGLELAMAHDVDKALSYLLFRKVAVTKTRDIRFPKLDPDGLTSLQQALAERPEDETLWLIGNQADASGLDGFVRCVAQEATHRVRGLYIDDPTPPSPQELARIHRVNLVSNVWRGGSVGSFLRTNWVDQPHTTAGPSAARNYQIRTITAGDLKSIRRVPDWVTPSNTPRARVKHFPLNFKDAMLASGRISSSVYKPFGEAVGLEYAGVLEDGTRIAGLNLSQLGIAQYVSVESPLTWWKIPETMSLEEACTIPVAYATAYAGIVLKGRARSGQRIFVHSGAGAVGQAAIRIALNLGMDVYTTVGSDQKRDFLLERFPKLDAQNILNSRSTEFKSKLLELTGGNGVDIVLNSFSGERLIKSLEVLGKYGHFVDISRYDAFENSPLPMKHFLKNISYSNVALDEMYRDGHPDVELIHGYISRALASGEIEPISHSKSAGVIEAVQELLRGDTIGKLVLDMDDCQKQLSTHDVFACDPDKIYILTGGVGGVGLELCQWLISRGARELLIATRSRELTAYQTLKVENWRARNIAVHVVDTDLSSEQSAEELVRGLEQRKPVGGVFHLAMALRDQLISDVSFDDFTLPIRVKLDLGQSLNWATRTHCKQLDHFVVFSSAIAFYGNEGQSNYGYANSALERMCEDRRRDGLPAIAIQWGALGDVGFVAREKIENAFSHLGMKAMGILSVLSSLDQLLLSDAVVVSAYAPIQADKHDRDTGAASRNLLDDVMQIMGFEGAPPADSHDRTLSELGVDSLMIVEINQILSRDYSLSLVPKQIRDLTFRRLQELGGNVQAPSASKPATTTNGNAIHSVHDTPPQTPFAKVCYYVDGMFLDAARNLARAQKDDDTCYVHIPYHDGTTNLDALERAFLTHLRHMQLRVKHVRLVGFSFGSVVASVLAEAAKRTVPELFVDCFAVPHTVYAEAAFGRVVPLVNSMPGGAGLDEIGASLRFLIAHSEDNAIRERLLAALREEFVAPDETGHMVSYQSMLAGLLFLYENRARLQPRVCDRVTVFANDSVSISEAQASELSNCVRIMRAAHDSGALSATAFTDGNGDRSPG